MKHYQQLALAQRYQIYSLKKAQLSDTQTAAIVGVNKSTMGRELKRNRGLRGYRPAPAEQMAAQRREEKVVRRISTTTWSNVNVLLREEWSPEPISGWLDKEQGSAIRHEGIYQHLLRDKRAGGRLYRHLRCQKQRRKHYGSHHRRGKIPNPVSIEERPAIVETRRRFGDWELDTVIGAHHQQALVTIVERKSRLSLIAHVVRKTAAAVSDAIIELLKPHHHWVHTLTADNGLEFADHETMAAALKADFFFAHPYASWERGLNENTNGLIRQYFPKGFDFTTITKKHVERVMNKPNNRPRKCLGFKTPNEVFFQIKPDVALAT